MKKFTVFCRDLSDATSTTFIEAVEADTAASAARAVREACADAWEFEVSDVSVIGVCEGDVSVLEGDDYGIDLK